MREMHCQSAENNEKNKKKETLNAHRPIGPSKQMSKWESVCTQWFYRLFVHYKKKIVTNWRWKQANKLNIKSIDWHFHCAAHRTFQLAIATTAKCLFSSTSSPFNVDGNGHSNAIRMYVILLTLFLDIILLDLA